MMSRWQRWRGNSGLLSAALLLLAQAPLWAGGPELMSGFPPPAERRVTLDNFMQAPYNRWALQHIRELQPSREVYRGSGPVNPLEPAPLDIGQVSATVRDNRELTLAEFIDESYTDAFLVLHRGKIVYERYLNGMQAHRQHQMFSATKSFVGTLMLLFIDQGRVDPSITVGEYLPELRGSAFGDATVQQVLDMTTAIDFSEIYDDPDSEIWRYGWVFRVFGHPPKDYTGPQTIYDYLPTLDKEGRHGQAFHYVTPNTDVLAWILSRVAGKTLSALVAELLWQPLGVERDGYFWLDGGATEMAGGGLNITARDAARFGQMIIQDGLYGGRQVLPERVTRRILQPGNPAVFTRYYPDDPWYGTVAYAYHDQWWTFNNKHRAVSAIGVHGQYIYLDPEAGMVVVKQSSSPDAEGGANEGNDVDGPLLYHALAEWLLAREADNAAGMH